MSIYSEYTASLKHPEAEELLDLVVFRPLAFILVKGVLPFPITPNQITIVAILFGVAAGILYGFGTPWAFFTAACFYALSNILDCADGMIARLKRNGTEVGRIIDGVADYITSIAIYVGLGIGLTKMGVELPFGTWTVVLVGGVSHAIHAFLFDYYRNEFMASLRGETSATAQELADSREILRNLREARTGFFRRLLIHLYIRYSALQVRGGQSPRHRMDAEEYARRNRVFLRLWSYIGSTTHIAILVVMTLIDRIDLFFLYNVALANIWMILLWITQTGRDRRLAATGSNAETTLPKAQG